MVGFKTHYQSLAPALIIAFVAITASVAMGQSNPHLRGGAKENPAAEEDADNGDAAEESDESSSTIVDVNTEFGVYADTTAVEVYTPAVGGTIRDPTSGWSATGSYLLDIVSAASTDIVSTASGHWVEERHVGSLSGTYKPSEIGATVSGSISREPDYLSLSAGASVVFELADKTVNPTLSYSYTHDTAGLRGTPYSVFSYELQRHTATAALELVVSTQSTFTAILDGIREEGNQAKPYRFLPVFTPQAADLLSPGSSISAVNQLRLPGRVNEQLPLSRNRFALTGRLATRLSGSTLILSERLYSDDWGLKASTTDLRFLGDLGKRLFLWTHLRGHIQTGVSFWRLAIETPGFASGTGLYQVPTLRTGDRELSPLFNGSFGGGARWYIGPDTRPVARSLVFQTDLFLTFFSDALFIRDRQGLIGVLQFETEL